jgi:hypothetical protein
VNVICQKPVNKLGHVSLCTRARPVDGEHEGECDSPYYFATDDRGIERVDATCDHPKCRGAPCRAYSDETRKVTDADAELGARLVAEGWWSTSRKYRSLARWKERVPTIEQIFRPDVLETFHGQRLAKLITDHVRWHYNCGGPTAEPHLEHAECSPSVFAAFKAAGGDCGR